MQWRGPGFGRCRFGLADGVGFAVSVVDDVWRIAKVRLADVSVDFRMVNGGVFSVVGICSVWCSIRFLSASFRCFHCVRLCFRNLDSGAGARSRANAFSCRPGNARQTTDLDTSCEKRNCACAASLTEAHRSGRVSEAGDVIRKALSSPDEGDIRCGETFGEAGGEKQVFLAASKLVDDSA